MTITIFVWTTAIVAGLSLLLGIHQLGFNIGKGNRPATRTGRARRRTMITSGDRIEHRIE
jgi:hypothetical protein